MEIPSRKKDGEDESIPNDSIEDQKLGNRKRKFDEIQIGQTYNFDKSQPFNPSSSFPENNNNIDNNSVATTPRPKNANERPKKKRKKMTQKDIENDKNNSFLENETLTKSSEAFDFPKIELSDFLTPSKEKSRKKNNISRSNKLDELQKEENLSILRKMDDESRGRNNMVDDPLILKQKTREEGFKFTSKKMKKEWEEVDEKMEKARYIPIFYQDHHRSGNNKIAGSGLQIEDDFNKKMDGERLPSASFSEVRKLGNNNNIIDDKDEMNQRLNELKREKRELSYFVSRRKRLGKIKSRKFRRKLRKKQEKQEFDIFKTKFGNKSSVNDKNEELKKILQKEEKEYIKERMTLRTKNQSKWTKRAIAHRKGTFKEKMLRPERIDDLKEMQRKVPVEHMENSENNKKRELERLVREEESALYNGAKNKVGGIMNMKFMRERREKNLEELKNELSGSGNDKEESDGFVKKSFVPTSKGELSVKKASDRLKEGILNDKDDTTSRTKVIESENNIVVEDFEDSEENVILMRRPKKRKREYNVNTENFGNFYETKNSNHSENEGKMKMGDEDEDEDEEEEEEEEDGEDYEGSNPWFDEEEDEDNSIEEYSQNEKQSDSYSNEEILPKAKRRKLIPKEKMMDEEEEEMMNNLKNEAFENDNLQSKFLRKKEEMVNEDVNKNLPSMEDKNLPGWDNWTGAGLEEFDEEEDDDDRIVNDFREKEKRRLENELKDEIRNNRKDSGFKNVIISESSIPDPKYFYNFKLNNHSREKKKIHDNLKSRPLGKEWNSFLGYKKINYPRDYVGKRGKIIQPLSKEGFEKMKNRI